MIVKPNQTLTAHPLSQELAENLYYCTQELAENLFYCTQEMTTFSLKLYINFIRKFFLYKSTCTEINQSELTTDTGNT